MKYLVIIFLFFLMGCKSSLHIQQDKNKIDYLSELIFKEPFLDMTFEITSSKLNKDGTRPVMICVNADFFGYLEWIDIGTACNAEDIKKIYLINVGERIENSELKIEPADSLGCRKVYLYKRASQQPE